MAGKTVLHIISSARGNASYSKGLSTAIIQKLKTKQEIDTIIERDLTLDRPPHFDPHLTKSFYQDPRQADEPTRLLLQYADTIVEEVRKADILVLGTPMYNLGMSALLKAWIDQLVRFGITYHYDPHGVRKGNLNGKKIYLAIASGGKITDWPEAYEFIAAQVNAVFNAYIGTTALETFRVEGTAMPGFQADYQTILEGL